MKNYFKIENTKYYVRESLPVEDVVLMCDNIIADIFGTNVCIYLKDYIVKYYLIKTITTFPLPDDIKSSWEYIKCSRLWKELDKTGVLRNSFYKTLLDDINNQIKYEAIKHANKPDIDAVLEGINFEELIKLQEKYTTNNI